MLREQMGYLSLALGDSLGRSSEDLGRKRAKEDLSQLSSEDKLERTRLQNKTHSRRSRLRKKMYEEQLKSVGLIPCLSNIASVSPGTV